jgi:hypothetical protein
VKEIYIMPIGRKNRVVLIGSGVEEEEFEADVSGFIYTATTRFTRFSPAAPK